MKPPHHEFTMEREVRLLLQILNPHKGNESTRQQSVMVMNNIHCTQ